MGYKGLGKIAVRKTKQYRHTAFLSGIIAFLVSLLVFMFVGVAFAIHNDRVMEAQQARQERLERQRQLEQEEKARQEAEAKKQAERAQEKAKKKEAAKKEQDQEKLQDSSAQGIITQIANLENQQGVAVSVAWVDAGEIRTAGSLTDFPAWSTSKVPLALALYKNGLASGQEGNISAAIQLSDNGAAEAMWAALAPDDVQRAARMGEIFRDAGDAATTVPSTHLYPGYTIFGQTSWSTSSQVAFLMNFDSLPGSAQVKSYMSNYAGNQAWGIGRYSGSALKGGWGPTRWGGYTARQFGWYIKDGQSVPIAIAAQAGSFGGATAVVDQVAQMFQ